MTTRRGAGTEPARFPRRRLRAPAACLIPLGAGALLALVAIATATDGSFTVSFPLSAALPVAGGALSAALLLVLVASRGRRAARASGRSEGVRGERDAHRRFLARLDHELKNPVTAIRSAIAAEPVAGSSPHLRIASAQADRLGALVSELRALAELETRDIEHAHVDLAAVALEEVEALRGELDARRTVRRITVAFPTAPWPLPPVAGDVDLLSVAVRNLLVNAAKYSGEGASIEVRGSEHDGAVVLDVADTGSGIPAEEVPYVWDELWRGTGARAVEGTGLGLSLVRIVAQRHGGTATLRSEPGRGTSVQLRLPPAAARRGDHGRE